nr:immunoglobulin light chain junction region [Macaca mulatta]MOW15587.1 immunoglobulin light chain junction region [Macaca mulatta]MOW17642.1 immunoglobulin light chain junction region [Macaca mulatta]MOW17894.1 immunoglobulin light chain junction region [Macaca mulatta]
DYYCYSGDGNTWVF